MHIYEIKSVNYIYIYIQTRWNACHAASNLLLNPTFPIGYIELSSSSKQQYNWTNTLYNSLIKALTKCSNYKVRINACLALATPKQIRFYGDCIQPIFQAILSTWHACHDPNRSIEYQELKYHEQLKDQVNIIIYIKVNKSIYSY